MVLVHALARASGRSVRSVQWEIERGGWWRPYADVAAPPGVPRSPANRAAAAALHARGRSGDAARDLAAVTGRSALHLYGLTRSGPSRIEVVIPHARRVAPHPSLAVRRSRLLRTDDVTTLPRGIPVVAGAALVRDLAAVRDLRRLRDDTIELLQRGLVDLPAIDALLERSPRFLGATRVRAVLAELQAAGRTDSPFELLTRRRCAAAGIPLDRGQVAVPRLADDGSTRVISLDLGIAAIRFGIECDSFAFHHRTEDLQRDAVRRNHLARVQDDWRVVHLTWRDVHGGWESTATMLRELISAQSWRHLGRSWPRPGDLRR